MNPGRHFTVKAVKPGIQEGIAHLAGAVRTEVEEKHHVIVAHALFVAVGKNAGLQEFIRLALGVALFHIFGGGTGALFAAAQHDGVPCQLVAVPALVAVHRIEAADNRGDFRAVRLDGFFQLAHESGPAGGGTVTAVRDGMDADVAHARFIGVFDDAYQMVDMAVHAAVAHQAEQVQAGAGGLGKSGLQHGIFTHGAVLDGVVHPAKILENHAASAQDQ